jgi:hypothetical protein
MPPADIRAFFRYGGRERGLTVEEVPAFTAGEERIYRSRRLSSAYAGEIRRCFLNLELLNSRRQFHIMRLFRVPCRDMLK